MKKIVFVVNSVRQARCIRRIAEFKDYGFEIEAYGFDREDDNRASPSQIEVIGVFLNGNSYFQRLLLIRRALLKQIVKKYDPLTTIYYLFNLDIVLAFKSIISTRTLKYIYEVSDLAELIIPNKIIKKVLVSQNKKAMRESILNVFTSEGFCDYYNDIPREKIFIVPNRINSNVPSTNHIVRVFDPQRIKVGFVGIIRFETVLNFAKVVEKLGNVEFHLYGMISRGDQYALELEKLSMNSEKIIFHGIFNNPTDLPSIYENIDMVFSAYPPTPGVIYAEPNKLYEAIYFRCPIIVNDNTFLSKKVKSLGVGFSIDAMNLGSIMKFLHEINENTYNEAVSNCKQVDQKDCLNINDDFLKLVSSL